MRYEGNGNSNGNGKPKSIEEERDALYIQECLKQTHPLSKWQSTFLIQNDRDYQSFEREVKKYFPQIELYFVPKKIFTEVFAREKTDESEILDSETHDLIRDNMRITTLTEDWQTFPYPLPARASLDLIVNAIKQYEENIEVKFDVSRTYILDVSVRRKAKSSD